MACPPYPFQVGMEENKSYIEPCDSSMNNSDNDGEMILEDSDREWLSGGGCSLGAWTQTWIQMENPLHRYVYHAGS